jgi:putative restriction endonuclease
MTPDEIRERFNSITVWKRGGERAPHKPLLALYAIGRVLRGEPPMVAYAEVDRELSKLLMEFGPCRKSYHPEYPFRHLQTDRLWVFRDTLEVVKRRGKNSPTKKALIDKAGRGFSPDVQQELSRNKRLTSEIVQDLLNANFPETIHQHASAGMVRNEGISKIQGRAPLRRAFALN